MNPFPFWMDTSGWYESIPLADFDKGKSALMKQLGATQWSSKIEFYRQTRSPRSVSELWVGGKYLVWISEKCFILNRKLPLSVPHSSKYRKATANIEFGSTSLFVYGKTNDIVARAIVRFLLLPDDKDESAVVRIGTDYNHAYDPKVPTTFLTTQFLSQFMQAHPKRQLILGRGCHLSEEQAIALASHPEPLDVGLECAFENDGRTFVETLAKRTSTFGTLSLRNASLPSLPVFRSVMNEVQNITLHMTSEVFHRNVHLPMTSVAKRIQYEIWGPTYFEEMMEPFTTVIPEAFTVIFICLIPVRFHTLFLQKSGNLRELGMIYRDDFPPSVTQRTELLQAIAANYNLYRLELGCFCMLAEFWEELLEVLGSHESLRSVVFWFRTIEVDARQVESLVPFIKEHVHLDISFKCHGPRKDKMIEAEAIVENARLKNRARALTSVSVTDRSAVLGAALTSWAGGSVSKTRILLSENTDLLCSLIGQPLSSPSLAPERLVETRKRNAGPFPETNQKVSKTET